MSGNSGAPAWKLKSEARLQQLRGSGQAVQPNAGRGKLDGERDAISLRRLRR